MDKMTLTWTLVAQLILLLCAMAVLTRFLFRPMLAVFEKRRQAMEGPKETAVSLQQEAERAKAAVEDMTRRTRAAAEKTRGDLLGGAQSEERQVVGEARRQAEAVRIAATRELDDVAKRARARLQAEAENLAEQLSVRLLRD
jgi:F-type H+-transporting ATPase subunit b